jgi:hypothetical protein
MKKLLSFAIGMLFLSSVSLFAQATSKGDTLIIGPLMPDGVTPVGALNYYISSDTNETGERLHSVYKILRGEQYLLTETIKTSFPFMLVADEPDADHRPPIIRSGTKGDGSPVAPLMQHFDNVTIKNVWISGIAPTGDSPISWHILNRITNNKRLVYEGCIFEAPYTWWTLFSTWGQHNVHIFKDCYFKNIGSPKGSTWNGAVLGDGLVADSVIIRNSTFFNFIVATNCSEDLGVLYTEIDHCTFVNSMVHQFILNKPVTAKITNNVFYNCHAYSDDNTIEIPAHPDKEVHGIIHVFEFDPFILDSVWVNHYDPNSDGTLEESERSYELTNNAWFYSQGVRDYWAANDTVVANPFMNDTVKINFFDNDEKYPLWVDENNVNVDPGFKNIGDSDVKIAENCVSIREGGEGVAYHYDPDGSYTVFEWPLSEDLSYTNTDLEHASTDGKPLGSLQWWADYDYTAIRTESNIAPQQYSLTQNYPNPFNPSTTISFSIPKSGEVTLAIYNMLGQKVKTLVSEKMNAGTYSYKFDASTLSSGVYIYQINVGNNFHQSKKMILLK